MNRKFLSLFIFFIFFICNYVSAVSGVIPASYSVDFEPGYVGEFAFDFILDSGVNVDLVLEGGLAEYVRLDNERISGREKVVALLHLPYAVDSYGNNYIKIIAGSVMGVIKVYVPYPREYLDLDFDAPNVNKGENVRMNLKVFNPGEEAVSITPLVEIYSEGEIIKTLNGGSAKIVSGGSQLFEFSLNTINYSAGDYSAVAVVEFDGNMVREENSFRVGNFSVEVINYSFEFPENEVSSFEIDVASLWDSDLYDVYVEINVPGFEGANFVTSASGLKAWQTKKFSGFLDTTFISGYDFVAEIVVRYDGGTYSELVDLKIRPGIDRVFWGCVVCFVLVIGLLIWRGKIFFKQFKKYCGLK